MGFDEVGVFVIALCVSATIVLTGNEIWSYYFKKVPVVKLRGFQNLAKFESPADVSKWEAEGMTRYAYIKVNSNQIRAIQRELKRRNSIDL